MSSKKPAAKKASSSKDKGAKKEKDAKPKATKSEKTDDPSAESKGPNVGEGSGDPALISFDAGQIFSKFDQDGDGKLSKLEFTRMVRQNPALLTSGVDSMKSKQIGTLPTALGSNRILTHFDETAGVAIPSNEYQQHKNMGNVVTTLVEAYKARYDRLRTQLTGKLLPKREHLLQLRRQLQNISVEVDARRRGIERETLTDTEQILERLRAVESMRQSSIKHQVIQLEEELHAIERIVQRVEQANKMDEVAPQLGPDGKPLAIPVGGTGITLTSAVPGTAPIETFRAPRAFDMVELIHQFGDLSSNIERLAVKPIAVQVDFPTDDFPKETKERLEVLSRCDKYMHALNVKDHMLWVALEEKNKLEESLHEEKRLCQEYAQEISSWAEMSQELAQQKAAMQQQIEMLERRNKDLVHTLKENNIFYNPPQQFNT